MLTYNPTLSRNHALGNDKPLLLLLLCTLWVLAGLWGHEPWKSDELFQISIIQHMAHGDSWLIPQVGEAPLLHTPPLYFWVATLCAKWFSPWLLPFHDAARLATGLFLGLTLTGIGMAARSLYGNRTGRLSVLALIGSLGFVGWGHSLATEIGVLAGMSWLLWGIASSVRRPGSAALVGSLGFILTFYCGSLLESGLALLLLLLLPCWKPWRHPNYLKMLRWMLPVSLLVCSLWPILLGLQQPELARHWLSVDGVARFSFSAISWESLSYFPRRLSWFAWPVLPLALWTLWVRRHAQAGSEALALTAFVLWLLALVFIEGKRDVLALPVLLPLALLAGGGIDSLRRGAAAALNWFGVLTFGVFALFVWLAWSGATLGFPAHFHQRAAILNPGYHSLLDYTAIAIAIALTVIWLWAITRRRPMARQAITNWTLGLTMLWILLVALALPWVDASKSYRPMVQTIKSVVPDGYRCIDTHELALAYSGALHYFGDLKAEWRPAEAKHCELKLERSERLFHASAWPVLWEGAPSWARNEKFRLIARPAQTGQVGSMPRSL